MTVSDKKVGVPDPGNSSLITYYTADVRSAQDCYPFGMRMSGREGLPEDCVEELQETRTTLLESDFNSGVTTSGNFLIQNGITWKPFITNVASIYLVDQAVKVDALVSGNGITIL